MPASLTFTLSAALLTMAVTMVVAAPAAWLSGWLAPPGPVRLVAPAGTLWHGSAQIAVSDGERALLLPGRVSWRLDGVSVLSGRVGLIVSHPFATGAVHVAANRDGIALTAGSAHLPAALLVLLGAPFNTLRPGGDLLLAWNDLRIAGRTITGRVELEWHEARSALSPVVPLGTFRVVATGAGNTGDIVLTTLSGPLLLQGRGRMSDRVVRFSGTADADAAMRPRLGALIGVLGTPVGDHATLDWALRI